MNKQEERETLDRFLKSLPTHSYLHSVCYGLREHLDQQMAVDHAEPWVTRLEWLFEQIEKSKSDLEQIEKKKRAALSHLTECERQDAKLQRQISDSKDTIDQLVDGLRRI